MRRKSSGVKNGGINLCFFSIASLVRKKYEEVTSKVLANSPVFEYNEID